ncbi:hypothetical protein BGZ47_010827 [Haplosporangium gracile]|nr:hypothetical protein BGZ47_010827 [Haplosporangium gracile]
MTSVSFSSTQTVEYGVFPPHPIVGLYDILGHEAVIYGINHSERSIVVSSTDHIASLLRDAGNMSSLKTIISMDSLKESAASKTVPESALSGPILRTFAADKGVQLLDWDGVEALGQLPERHHTPPRPEDTFTVCCTSDTAGMPKGAIIIHANLVATLASSEVANPLSTDDCIISFLPAVHLYGRAMEFFFRIYARVYAATAKASGLAGALARKGLFVELANLEAELGNKHAL